MKRKIRPYQSDIIDKLTDNMRRGIRRNLIVLQTGGGKTVIASEILKRVLSKGNSAFFNVHRVELVEQSARTFYENEIPFGIVSSGFGQEQWHQNLQVCSVQTLAKRIQNMRRTPNVIIWDEAHHCAAPQWKMIFDLFPNSYHIGLTATPERLDGKGLRAFFDEMIIGPSMKWLIEEGYLTPYKYFRPPTPMDFSNVHKRMGDYIATDLAAVVDTPMIRGDVIKQWKSKALNEKTIMFAVNVEHSKNMVEEFTKNGFRFEHVDGGTEKAQRRISIKNFKDGLTRGLSNVNLFGEGFDVPSATCMIDLKKTLSLSFYRQKCGRVLRPEYAQGYDLETTEGRLAAIRNSKKPHAIILDMVGNYQTHSFPDEEIEWSLDGKSGRDTEKSTPSKECPRCYTVDRGFVKVCSNCGHEYKVEARVVEITHSDEELVEVDFEKERRERKQAQGLAQTKEELVALGIKNGYKNPYKWAEYVLKGREEKARKRGLNGN